MPIPTTIELHSDPVRSLLWLVRSNLQSRNDRGGLNHLLKRHGVFRIAEVDNGFPASSDSVRVTTNPFAFDDVFVWTRGAQATPPTVLLYRLSSGIASMISKTFSFTG